MASEMAVRFDSGPYGLRDGCALRLGAELDKLADDGEDMALALLGRDKLLDFIGEEYAAHLVVVLRSREGQHCRNLGDDVLLQAIGCTKRARVAHIDQEHHRQLALLLINLDVGLRRAGRNVPVNIAHIVAGTILPHLRKRHTASAESSVILSRKDLVRQTSGLNLDFANSFENIVLSLLHRH